MKLSEFHQLEVVAQDGTHLGHVIDLRCAGDPEHVEGERIVTELVYGKAGWLERLGFKAINECIVTWQAVVALQDGKIVLAKEGERL